MKVAAVLFVLLSAFLVCNAADAADWVLYDNFNTKTINPSKWSGAEWTSNQTVEENTRMIEKNTLNLLTRFYGQTGLDTGVTNCSNLVRFANPKPIYGIKATVRVKGFSEVDCAANPTPSYARVRINGYFFNMGTSTPGSALNDVYALIGIRTNPEEELEVFARAWLCTNANCSASTEIGSLTLGTINLNKKTTLSLEWDQANNRFIFQQDNLAPVYINYDYPDSSEPGMSLKYLDAHGGAANCTNTPRPSVFVDAYFDDVYVKTTAALPDSEEE
jgi:hypothetical protein